jgi:short-subunit dehydrogenase
MGTALITGASAGLGAEYAKLFAADKHDLVLVARRRDRLEALARELEASHGIKARVVAADLGASGGAAHVLEEVRRLGLQIDFLVNNAGFGASGAFAVLDAARQLEMIQLNIVALVTLTRALLPAMIARRSGRILNVGSTAGFPPGPFMAVYYASKAFVNSFSEGLSYELRGTGVTATVSCPGATATEFAGVAGNSRSLLFRLGAANAATVARQGYAAMMKGKAMVIHGFKNKLTVQSLRISPRAIARAVAASMNPTPPAPAEAPRAGPAS